MSAEYSTQVLLDIMFSHMHQSHGVLKPNACSPLFPFSRIVAWFMTFHVVANVQAEADAKAEASSQQKSSKKKKKRKAKKTAGSDEL